MSIGATPLPSSHAASIAVVSKAVEFAAVQLREINLQIYKNPETKFEEFRACKLLCDWFEARPGWTVKRGAYGLETAFEARLTIGTGGRTICYNAEYDALPDIGHACGHNLIATSALASAIGFEALMRAQSIPGTLIVMGTPAEETGGGKDLMAKNGAWRDCDAAMMVHAFHNFSTSRMSTRASLKFRVEYYGQPAHAAAAPWEGRNACDAIVQAYVAIGALRQLLKPSESIQGVIVSAGEVPNIIPILSKGTFSIRTNTSAQLAALQERVSGIFEGAALATGCTHKVFWDCQYDDIVSNRAMCDRYDHIMKENFGVTNLVPYDKVPQGTASSDFGNCTYICPGIQSIFCIHAKDAPHTAAFEVAAGTAEAHAEALKVGKTNALVGLDLLSNDEFFEKVHNEWSEEMKVRGVDCRYP